LLGVRLNLANLMVTGPSRDTRKAHQAHTPSHRERPKADSGSSHTARPARAARRSREPRPRSAVFMPANTHRTAMELTGIDYDTENGMSNAD